MTKKEYIKLFTKAIKKSDKALVFDIENTECAIDEDGVYFEFDYQIDDRKNRLDTDVVLNIKKWIGDEYGVSINRVDVFPNGYAAYTITIDS